MNFFVSIYTEVIYRPLLNGLAAAYLVFPARDLGLAILLMTVAVRLLLHPAIARAARSQRAMTLVAPKLREIKDRFGDQREEQARRTMALYREHGIHPLSGCLPILVQLPVLIGLYQVFWKGIALADPGLLYPPLRVLGAFDPIAFGLIDLSARSAVLAVAAGASQLLQGALLPQPGGGGEFERAMRWQTRYVFPAIIAFISWSLPSALALYWTAFNILAIVQQRWIDIKLDHERALRTHPPNA